MTEKTTSHLVDVPVRGKEGAVWNRLHEERENICEVLVKRPDRQADLMGQARLKTIDEALDQLMSGTFGLCSSCGNSIEPMALEIDPAWPKCFNCLVHGPRCLPVVQALQQTQGVVNVNQ
jgi:hypothetical protein